MGYTYTCDSCRQGYNTFPPFAGEFTETFLNTHGGKFALDFDPGEKVTLCRDCMDLMVLSGQIAVCRMCGYATELDQLPDREPDCPQCEDGGELHLREREQNND